MNSFYRLIFVLSVIVFTTQSIFAKTDQIISDSIKTAADTTSIGDSLIAKKVKKLIPLSQFRLTGTDEGYLLSKKKIDFNDYRTTIDLAGYLPGGIARDLGYMGNPGEVTFFSFGFGNVSFLGNGLSLENKWNNSYNANHFPSERLKSIELLPVTKGFLYSNMNNPVSINFSSDDSITSYTLTRIRYYQGPNDEGFIDASFSSRITSRINGELSITNQASEGGYSNSKFESWNAGLKIAYLFSNNINIRGEYNYLKSRTGLYGGVDVDQILQTGADLNENLYDETTTFILRDDRYVKAFSHYGGINILALFDSTFYSSIKLYGNYEEEQFRQNEYNSKALIPLIFDNNKYNSIGADLYQSISLSNINAVIKANYETTDMKIDAINSNSKVTSFSLSGELKYHLLSSKLVPEVYAKYLSYEGSGYSGFGAQVILKPNDNFTFFAGASRFEKPYSYLEKYYLPLDKQSGKSKIKAFQASVQLNIKSSQSKLIYTNSIAEDLAFPIYSSSNGIINIDSVSTFSTTAQNAQNLSFISDIHLWKLLLSINANYNLSFDSDRIPDHSKVSLIGGVYYVDTLFNENLNLKTGFTIRYNSSQEYRFYNFEIMRPAKYYMQDNSTLSIINSSSIESAYTIDFFLAGRIQDRATVYFTVENILNNQYFLAPYYLNHFRSFRVGIAWDFIN